MNECVVVYVPIVTAKVQKSIFPAMSVAVHRTVVIPSGNVDSDGGMQRIESDGNTPSTLSVAFGLFQVAICVLKVMAAGHEIIGLVRSVE